MILVNDFIDYGTNNNTTPSTRQRILVVDGTNVLFRVTNVINMVNASQDHLKKYEKDILELTDDDQEIVFEDEDYLVFKRNVFKGFLNMVLKHKNLHKCDKVYVCFDIGKSWRALYTTNELEGMTPLTEKVYKGKRRLDMTLREQIEYKMMKLVGNEIATFIHGHTNIKCFHNPILEADDFMGQLPQHCPEHDFIILSTDGDMTQLLRFSNVQVYDLHNKRMREECDVDWFLFEKCIRGDKSDNVRSAFPGVRTTRLKKAYEDPFEHTNIMETVWVDKEDKTKSYTVKDIYAENQMLMDLTKQPEHIKTMLTELIAMELMRESNICNKFSLGKSLLQYQLDHLHDDLIKNKLNWLC